MNTTYPLLELGGSGPLLHLALANGFPPAAYTPLLRPLLAHYRALCLPPRALWPREPVPAALRQWDMLADDLLAGMTQHDLPPLVAVGHSFGGVASLIAAVREPGRFRALVLLDPTVFMPEWLEGMERSQQDGSIRDFPLAQGALNRRSRFPSVEAALANWRTKALFRGWPEETLRLYAEHGTRPTADGERELVWPPEWEAYYFCTGYTRTWEMIPRLPPDLPVLVIRGETTDVFMTPAAERFGALCPHAQQIVVAGHGHLFPQTAPAETAAHIAGWLKTVMGNG